MGDIDYARHGQDYAQHRRADPRIEAQVHAALGDARSVLNIGAGAGSYEPLDRHVIAIEPALAMRQQRPKERVPSIAASAQALPLDDQSVDAAMAMATVHQWTDKARGLAELVRVTRGPILILTFDPDALERFWVFDYVPELLAADRRRLPAMDDLCAALGMARTRVEVVPIPHDCTDGFIEAFYARPEKLLDVHVRGAQSAWTFVDKGVVARFEKQLGQDLDDGTWDRRYGELRKQPTFEGSLRLVVRGS